MKNILEPELFVKTPVTQMLRPLNNCSMAYKMAFVERLPWLRKDLLPSVADLYLSSAVL